MSAKQRTVNANSTVAALGNIGGLSTSGTESVQACFPASPLGTIDQLTDDGTHDASANPMMKWYQENVLDAVINDSGHTFGEVSMNFTGEGFTPLPPALGEVTVEGPAPASAWVPNPVSPGPGSVNPADQGAPPEGFGTVPSDTPGTGVGSQLGVVDSSAQQSSATLGAYGLGDSPYAGG
ncbi:MAG TPA: hypothetical protein EYG21_03120 [Nitrospinaceae bacterium]|jgi:hypothetical protein|nr:hypothetical protein [Nitrospinaceae bacterium]